MKFRFGLAVVLLGLASLAALGTPSRVAVAVTAEEVPARYQPLYHLLSAELDDFAHRYPSPPAGSAAPVWGAELLQANANRGEALLQPGIMGGVRLFLDRFQAMGFRGVTVSVNYPLLAPSFPRSAEYAAFYREVAREVRRRGLKLEVESGVLFANTAFSPITLDFKASSFEDFVAGRKQHVAAIVREMSPDWLDLGAEPDTEAKLSGFAQLNDPETRTAMFATILGGLDRGSTRIATGIGTWSDPRFLTTALARVHLDAVALHLYPVGRRQLDTLAEACRMARQAGKPVLLDEAWLYKIGVGENEGIATSEKVFKRDIWSFWTPLDQRFFESIDAFARTEGVAYVSPFWSHLYFATLPFDAALDQGSYQAANAKYLQAVLPAVLIPGRLSPLGETVKTLIAAAPQQAGAVAAPSGGYKIATGPWTSAAKQIVLHDDARQKDLEITVRYPQTDPSSTERFPLVIFSHGAGGSRDAFADLTTHWASHGYVVILPTHADSIELRRRRGEDLSRLQGNLDSLLTDVKPMDRLADVAFLLNSLDRIEALTGLRTADGKERLDRDRIGMAGHSAGALTTQIAFGVKVRTMQPGGMQPRSYGDARIKAAILISGQGTTSRLFTADSWNDLSKPMMVITGSKDVAPIGRETPSSRREPFERAKSGNKYLLFIEGATHSSYQGKGRALQLDRDAPGDEALTMITSVTASATLAFLDAYLKDEGSAKAYLASDALTVFSRKQATLEQK